MESVKSIGQILNTNPPPQPKGALKSERKCPCGNAIEPMVFGQFKHWPHLCTVCRDQEKEQDRLRKIRDNHRSKAAKLRRAIELLLPPLYRSAHLRDLSPQLRGRMLDLPPNKGLLFFGSPGVGKTYAMCALMRHYRLKGFAVRRITYDNLCLEIRDTYNTKQSEQDLIKQYQDVDKLLIEDVGTTVGTGNQESDFSLRIFLLILDHRLEHCKPTFITTNKSIEELGKSFDERVASRLHQACILQPVAGQDKRKRKG